MLVTQNVDNLHERGGSRQLIHMHGELFKIRCVGCRTVHQHEAPILTDGDEEVMLPRCDCGGLFRPHIVWFGEVPFEMETIQQALARATHFMAIGTSGVVYPAAGFLQMARLAGAVTMGMNLEPPENHHLFDLFYQGKAGELLPHWVDMVEV